MWPESESGEQNCQCPEKPPKWRSPSQDTLWFSNARYSSPPPPQMYSLPKIHEDGTHYTPMRPIVSTIGSPSYKLAKELTRILTPLTRNTPHAVDIIRKTHPEDRLISFDERSFQVARDLRNDFHNGWQHHCNTQTCVLCIWLTRTTGERQRSPVCVTQIC